MKITNCVFEQDDQGEFLTLKQDGKIVKRWKLDTMPKNDSLYESPADSFLSLVKFNSSVGFATIILP